MKLTLANTDKIVEVRFAGSSEFVRARIWQGVTESGIPVHCFIARVAVANSENAAVHARFAAELESCAPARAEIVAIPLRLIL